MKCNHHFEDGYIHYGGLVHPDASLYLRHQEGLSQPCIGYERPSIQLAEITLQSKLRAFKNNIKIDILCGKIIQR